MARADADLQGWFDGLSSRVKKRVAKVVKEEADAISAAQLDRLRSLEEPPDDTGSLETSCRVEEGRQEGEYVIIAGGAATTVNGYDHALGFEFGTSRQPARSFFYSVHRERAPAARQRIEDAVAEEMK